MKEAYEAQHNEQMVGLWRCGQKAMLGLELKATVGPKILGCSIWRAKLMITFLTCVSFLRAS